MYNPVEKPREVAVLRQDKTTYLEECTTSVLLQKDHSYIRIFQLAISLSFDAKQLIES